MKLDANLEIINNLASVKGYKKNPTVYSQISFAKDSSSGKHFLIINNTKKPHADKFKLSGNIQQIFCKFVHEGKATIILKDPNFTLIIQKANVAQLKNFLRLVQLAGNSMNISDELNKLQVKVIDENSSSSTSSETTKQLKKPPTSLTIRTKNEYASNFRAVLSQNMTIKTAIGKPTTSLGANLVKLVINNCELKRVDPGIFTLDQLTSLDLSNNKLTAIDEFRLAKLEELNLCKNEINSIGASICLPKLINLDLSNNKLVVIDKRFCDNFKSISKLNVSFNALRYISFDFGYNLFNLRQFYANDNQLLSVPYSFSHLRLQLVEMHNNPFDYKTVGVDINVPSAKKFPTLVELCARNVVNKKIKYGQNSIPRTLIEYLGMNNRCTCGLCSFQYHFKLTTTVGLGQIAKEFSYLGSDRNYDNQLPVTHCLCSLRCLKKNFKHKLTN